MGRIQLDLILLLVVLLIGSSYYSKNLRNHIPILESHCQLAKTENYQSLKESKNKLIELTQTHPQFKHDIMLGIKKMDNLLAKSTFAQSEKKEIDQTVQELKYLLPYSIDNYSQVKNTEEFYVLVIQTGLDYYHDYIINTERQAQLSILVQELEQDQDQLNIKLTPFNKFSFSDKELYIFTKQDSSLLSAPNFTFCGDLNHTKFVVKNNSGDHLSFTDPNPINSRP